PPTPEGGARATTVALLSRLTQAGGQLRLSTQVDRVVVRKRRAVGVRTGAGEEIAAKRAIVADVGAPALFLRMLPPHTLSWYLRWAMRRFRYGWGTFKMDWALSGPVPWTAPEARQSAVVHAGDSIADLRAFTLQVRAGQLPANPYLVIGQQSLADPGRAPAGCHTLWAY